MDLPGRRTVLGHLTQRPWECAGLCVPEGLYWGGGASGCSVCFVEKFKKYSATQTLRRVVQIFPRINCACASSTFFGIKRFNSRKDHFTIMDRVILVWSRCALCAGWRLLMLLLFSARILPRLLISGAHLVAKAFCALSGAPLLDFWIQQAIRTNLVLWMATPASNPCLWKRAHRFASEVTFTWVFWSYVCIIYIFRYSICSSYFSDPASEVPLFGVCLSWWISRNLRWRPHWPNLRQVPSKWVLLRGAMQCCSFESFETPSVKCTTLDNCHNCFIIICDICDMLDIASCDIWILFKLLCH